MRSIKLIPWNLKPPFTIRKRYVAPTMDGYDIYVPVIVCGGNDAIELMRDFDLAGGKEVAEKVVRILNKYWDEEEGEGHGEEEKENCGRRSVDQSSEVVGFQRQSTG